MTTDNIISIGKASAAVNALPDQVRLAASRLGIAPAARIDGREYYNEADVTRIGRFIQQQRAGDATLQQRVDGLS